MLICASICTAAIVVHELYWFADKLLAIDADIPSWKSLHGQGKALVVSGPGEVFVGALLSFI
jgi:hypothetical protein